MKLSIAKRMVVNGAIDYAKRVTQDVARLAICADEFVGAVKRNAKRDRIAVLEAAAIHIEISRSAGTTYKQLRKLYPPLPGAQLTGPAIIQGSAPDAPPASNTGETFPQTERPGGFLQLLQVDGRPVDVFEVLGGYV